MTIRYSRPVTIVYAVLGVLMVLVSLVTQSWFTVVVGVLIVVVSILMFVNPMLRIEPSEVQVRNPLGMTLRRFPVTSPADLALDGTALRHLPTNKRIAALGFGVDRGDVELLRRALGPRG